MKYVVAGLFSVIAGFLIQGCAASNPYFDSSKPHHRPDGFVNSDGTIVSKPMSDLLRWYRERFGKDLPPPPGEFIASYADFPLKAFDKSQLSKYSETTATWLGHATVMVRANGFTMLTDPHFSIRAFPVQWAGPSRKVQSPSRVENLPKIDVVVISHSHYDHLDHNTVVKLAKQQPDTLFLVPLGLESLLKSWGVENVKEMDWWETHTIGENQITFVPAYHWSARTLTDRNKSLWGGWTMKNPKLNFYFSGDTGYSKDFEEIGKRLGPFDFSAIAVGAYEPRWFMKAQHINPDEAVQIHKDVRSSKSMGIHWGTFELTDEPLDQPIGDLKLALEKHSVQPNDFELLGHGDTINLR